MDTFMDKLAQRINAQEMIKANAAADAAQLERYREQVAWYESYLANLTASMQDHEKQDEKLKSDLTDLLEKLNESAQADRESDPELLAKIEELFAKSDDFNHKEDVKVYRNVQAALVEENGKQIESLKGILATAEKKRRKLMMTILLFSILAYLGSTAAVTLQILSMFGMRFYW